MKKAHSSSCAKLSVLAFIIFTIVLLFTILFLQQRNHHVTQGLSDGAGTRKSKHHDGQRHHPHGGGGNEVDDDEHQQNDNTDNLKGFGENVVVVDENRKEGSEIGNSLYDQKLNHARSICELAFPTKFIRNVLNSAVRANKKPIKQRGAQKQDDHDGVPQDGSRNRKAIFFIGDSHALRTFRWTAMFLELSRFLQPASSNFVHEKLLYNFDLGIFHDSDKATLYLLPNPSRLVSIEFRRAAFVDDAIQVLDDITKKIVRREKNFEAYVLLSVAAWDILRPTLDRHQFTIDSLFAKLMKIHVEKQQQQQQQQQQIVNFRISDEESGDIFTKFVDKWRETCEKLNIALINSFGWGDDVDEDHHLRRQVTNAGVFGRVTWRWPGAPNCSASRFQAPRASPALQASCPLLAESWWESLQNTAKEVVKPMEKKPKNHGHLYDFGNDPKFDFVGERKNLNECLEKIDGVHPSHLCMAREAGSYLLRVLS